MSTGSQACEIVLPGYTLTERIGSGGYAEVWRAEAPGGIEKAVKIVYGYYDDEFASQELKALERIKGVRHPFLLSLERFEVLNGRLAILTELADMSLDQRRRQCRAEGLPGIPRDELLQYMADAAEALDFLAQKHNLLHLDIKPENLLVLGDHIKVADFGLVKELASRTQNSLVSGMTPTYASPEVFDDEPSASSDQYSLAIVYQEMLVGALPFPGRTAAQLAKQHTQAEPQLASAPIGDRPVLARALAKKPTERYPSCKAFVEALLTVGKGSSIEAQTTLPHPAPPVAPSTTPEADDTKPPSFCTTLRRSPGEKFDQAEVRATQPVQRSKEVINAPVVIAQAAPEPLVSEDIVDVAVPPINAELEREQPTLYVAAGGAGIQVLCRLLALTSATDDLTSPNPAIQAIALDTDRDELREACSNRWKSPLAAEDTLHLPLRLPSSYDNSREILGWVSRRWLYNIPRSLETRGYRPLGRVAIVDHSRRVLELLNRKLDKVAQLAGAATVGGESRDASLKVVILAGTGGGTGAGMVIDLGNAVKSLAATRNLQVEVHGCFVCTCLSNNASSPLVAANTYSLLTELNHVAAHGNVGIGENTSQVESFDSNQSPFDHVYWLPSLTRTKDAPQAVDVLDTVARYLALDRKPEARAAFRTCRSSKTPREITVGSTFTINKVGYASLADQKHSFIDNLATNLSHAIKCYWLTTDKSADWPRLVREAQAAAIAPSAAPTTNNNAAQPAMESPANDAAPLALRSQFNEYMSLEFTSEVLRQIQRQLESRDDRGRPRLLPREVKQIVDSARKIIADISGSIVREPSVVDRPSSAPLLHKFVAEGSRRVLNVVVEKFDAKQPDRVSAAEAINDIIRTECRALLESHLATPDSATGLMALVDAGAAANVAIESATTDLLQCGYDRRTIVFTPPDRSQDPIIENLRSVRPSASILAANVEDVLVVSEETGIVPRSLAIGLERVFPGIAEAARRLHTRIDIEWKELR